jgi:hypothetical protein
MRGSTSYASPCPSLFSQGTKNLLECGPCCARIETAEVMGLKVSEGDITGMKVKGRVWTTPSPCSREFIPAVAPALPRYPPGYAHHSCSGTCQASRWSYTIHQFNGGALIDTSCAIRSVSCNWKSVRLQWRTSFSDPKPLGMRLNADERHGSRLCFFSRAIILLWGDCIIRNRLSTSRGEKIEKEMHQLIFKD